MAFPREGAVRLGRRRALLHGVDVQHARDADLQLRGHAAEAHGFGGGAGGDGDVFLAAGVEGDGIHLHDSPRVLGSVAAIHGRGTRLQRNGASFTGALSDEGLLRQEYLDEAAAGASLIAVRAAEPGQMDQVSRILAARGARGIRFYGDGSVTAWT